MKLTRQSSATFALALLSLSALLAPACTRLGPAPRDLEYGSAADVDDILRKNGVAVKELLCRNPSHDGAATRAIACTTSLTPEQLATLTGNLPLRRGTPLPYGTDDNCESMPGLRSTDPGVDVLTGRNTRVPNGVGAVELHIARSTGAACIEIHYSWG